ncbi:MAG: N-6 DNA methylase [Candidatus Riflebacteria bacterium]|nr:N-6 DNA methylase [Candidatus Riflebacteria bacterium]
MSRKKQEFQTIRSEGGLLPPDLLRKVIDPKQSLPGTKPEHYGLPAGERINEVTTQSWNRLRKHWADFRLAAAKLPDTEPATGLTNDKWTLPLLRELGFGFLGTTAGPEIDGRTYAINRFFGPAPIHLVGCGVNLDRKAAGVRGAAAGNPHGLVQEFLNRSEPHLWAIVSNGLRLRILRDNQALSRQSFLEFDLEAMLTGEVYSDFVLLWLMGHATRFQPQEGTRPESCWLEQWTKIAEEQGTRALGDLRSGVEKALQILGEGFTSHPKNLKIREAFRSGEMSRGNFHGQLLRIVYRLIFLFVAEDRTIDGESLLHPRDESPQARTARERYFAHYSTARLRDLASKIKGSRHGDLWRQFQLLVVALSGEPSVENIRRNLALPALGSFLWATASTASLNDAELTNHDFLEALRHLAFTRQGKVLRPVDYKNLGAEELGGVYESLLALTPQISADGAKFTFAEFAGNERKTSGSYYTPDSLVQCLLDSALDPVVAEAIKGKKGADAEKAILALKVCDPAVGSGHFLVGAAHRLARHLARARSTAMGESEPSPLLYQHALRDVIGRCLYGVDINPMSAELCRVSLWLEALEPGKPLSFLDHHIRVGNSLLGATPELIANGIPDEAFSAIEGDEKKACTVLKKLNKAERKGLGGLFADQDAEVQSRLQQAAAALEELPDEHPDDIRAKELAFRQHEQIEEYRQKKQLADLWCAAFFILKYFTEPGRELSVRGITQGHLNDLASQRLLSADLVVEATRLSDHFQFFHWHLAFPEVFVKGGFDCILGNPPWEMMEAEDGAKASEESARLQLWFKANHYKVLNGRRDLYKLFLVSCSTLLRSNGRLGFLTPLGVFIEDDASEWRKSFFNRGSLLQLRHFQNHKKRFFPGVDSRYRLCGVTYSPSTTAPHRFSTVGQIPEELSSQYFVTVPRDEFDEWLGFERSAVIYSTEPYALLHRAVSRVFRAASSVEFKVVAEFHSSSDREFIRLSKPDNGLALLKNRNIHFFNYAFSPHEAWIEENDAKVRLERKGLLDKAWQSRFPRLVFRDIARNDDERTLIGCLTPPGAAVSTYDTPMFIPQCDASQYPKWIAFFGAAFSAFLFDFMIRPVVDKHIKGYTLARVPWPSPEKLPSQGITLRWFLVRMLEMVNTSPIFKPFAEDCGWFGPAFIADEDRRFTIRCELDAAFFHLYLSRDASGNWGTLFSGPNEELERLKTNFPLPRHAVEYIMETFPIVKRKDISSTEVKNPTGEVIKEGRFITKDTILEIYDAMADSIRSGNPYQTRLNPPPGPPTNPDGSFATLPEWKPGQPRPANWPPHIHPPKDHTK